VCICVRVCVYVCVCVCVCTSDGHNEMISEIGPGSGGKCDGNGVFFRTKATARCGTAIVFLSIKIEIRSVSGRPPSVGIDLSTEARSGYRRPVIDLFDICYGVRRGQIGVRKRVGAVSPGQNNPAWTKKRNTVIPIIVSIAITIRK